jgi:hypothetical protein
LAATEGRLAAIVGFGRVVHVECWYCSRTSWIAALMS